MYVTDATLTPDWPRGAIAPSALIPGAIRQYNIRPQLLEGSVAHFWGCRSFPGLHRPKM